MERLSNRVRRLAQFRCYGCGRRFKRRAWYVPLASSDLGTIGWALDRNSMSDNACPSCDSLDVEEQIA
jgi:hypothetical protein